MIVWYLRFILGSFLVHFVHTNRTRIKPENVHTRMHTDTQRYVSRDLSPPLTYVYVCLYVFRIA